MAKTWFAENGFAGELENHHQGGAIGYAEREMDCPSPARARWCMTGRPSPGIPSFKERCPFDTFIVYKDKLENLSEVPGWPTIPVQAGKATISLPDILVVREEGK